MGEINWHSFFFLLFALTTCVFAIAVVVTNNIVRMAFYLIASLGATSGLFFLAGATFVGAMQLMIYVGGTLVLLVFGVMLTAQGPFVTMRTKGGEWVLAAIVGGSLLAILLQAAFSVDDWTGPSKADIRPWGVTLARNGYHARVIVVARQPGPEMAGVVVRFEPRPEGSAADAVQARYDARAGELIVLFRPEEAAAKDVVAALNESDSPASKQFAALLPVGSNGSGKLDARDRATLALRSPRREEDATQLGMALLGARPDDPGGSGYLLPFEVISVHLLVVLVGAAYLARAKKRVRPADAEAAA